MLIVVVETSTIVSTTEVTESNAETQTNVFWITETETALARRAAATAEVLLLGRADHVPLEPRISWSAALKAAWASVTDRRLPHAIHDAGLVRRQATREPSAAAAPSTVTVVVAQTVDVTNVVSTTITTQSTSLVMTTVFKTNTM